MDNGESSYRRFLAGDNEGLYEIICTYQTGLILYLNSYVQNIHTAEDKEKNNIRTARCVARFSYAFSNACKR